MHARLICFVVFLAVWACPHHLRAAQDPKWEIGFGETRTYDADKNKGSVLLVECPTEGRAGLVSFLRFYANTAGYSFGGSVPFKGETGPLGRPFMMSVNVYCAPTSDGPWRWVAGTLRLEAQAIALPSREELGSDPRLFRFELKWHTSSHQHFTVIKGPRSGIRYLPVLNISVKEREMQATVAAPRRATAPQEPNPLPSDAASAEATSVKAFIACARSLIAEIATDRAIRVEYASGRYCPFLCADGAPALVGCVRAFALSASSEPRLKEPAEKLQALCDQASLWMTANYDHMFNWQQSHADPTPEVNEILNRLTQGLQAVVAAGLRTPKPPPGKGSTVGDHLALRLPYEDGKEFQVTQGFLGDTSHAKLTPYAVDFRLPQGTPVVAVAAGKVIEIGTYAKTSRDGKDPETGVPLTLSEQPGLFVKIEHTVGSGTTTETWFSAYLHLRKQNVGKGDNVVAGQVLGWSGETGYSTGPHLHFHMRDATGKYVPPIPMIGVEVETGQNPIRDFRQGFSYKAISGP